MNALPAPNVVLMVDDDSNDRLLIGRVLEAAGIKCDLREVHDGEQALDYLKGKDGFKDRAEFPLPKLLLCDIKMPKLTGLEVLQWIRSHKPFHKLPVIIMSSSDLPNDMAKAYQLGANEFLTKQRILKEPEIFTALLGRFIA